MIGPTTTDALTDSDEQPFTLLLEAACQVSTNPRQFLLHVHNHKLSLLEAIRTPIPNGPYKGQTILFIIAKAAAQGHNEAFLSLMSRYGLQLTIEDFRISAASDPEKNALWYLGYAACFRSKETFTCFWKYLGNALTIEDLRAKPQTGPDAGTTLLWLLSTIQEPLLFSYIWKNFSQALTFEDFNAQRKNESLEPISLWWNIVLLNYNSISFGPIFYEIWQKYKNLLDNNFFHNQAQVSHPPTQLSILQMLILREETLDLVFEHWGEFLTPEMLRKTTIIQGNLIPLIAQMVRKAFYFNNSSFLTLLNYYIRKFPDLLNSQELNFPLPGWGALINFIDNADGKPAIDLKLLLVARNSFIDYLTTASAPINKAELHNRAFVAKCAGFVDAYFFLGEFFLKQNMHTEALETFTRVPADAIHYDNANKRIVQIHLGSAVHTQKISFLEQGLIYALRIKNTSAQIIAVNSIAYCFLHHGISDQPLTNFLPTHIFTVLPFLPAHLCFKLFADYYEAVVKEEKIKALTQKVKTLTQENEILKLAINILKHQMKANQTVDMQPSPSLLFSNFVEKSPVADTLSSPTSSTTNVIIPKPWKLI